MYATPLDEFLAALHPLSEKVRHGLLTDYRLTSLIAVFTGLPDPRHHRGRRYSLPFLLTCLVAALLCNCNSTQAVEQWCREQQELLRRCFLAVSSFDSFWNPLPAAAATPAGRPS